VIKKNFIPRTISARPRLENSKKNSKKIKNNILASLKANMGRDRPKKRKKFSFRVPFLLDPSWGIPKKIVKKFQKLENVILASFLAKPG